MTDRDPSAVGARVLLLTGSVAATLALMGVMAAAPPDASAPASPLAAVPPAAVAPTTVPLPPASVGVDPARPASPPRVQATTAPPTTSSHAS